MRNWRKIFEPLTREPLGFAADGRTLGLGLATALEKARQDTASDVEEFLRRQTDDERQRISS
jgi:hypothetical protein